MTVREAARAGAPRLVEQLLDLDATARATRNAPEALAAWMAAHARHLGFRDIAVHRPAPGVPYVFGTLPGEGTRTVLVYGHVDVAAQAGRPVSFSRGWLTGAGVSDDRGRLLALLDGARPAGTVGPCPVVLVVDPEEERGSPHAAAALDALALRWTVNHPAAPMAASGAPVVALLADSTGRSDGGPAIVVGARGLVDAEIVVVGPEGGLHSGRVGGAAPGPAELLARVVSGLHDEDGRVALEGFYDDVRDASPSVRAALAAQLPDDRSLVRRLGRSSTRWGEPGWSAGERTVLRPALTVDALTTSVPPGSGGAVVPSVAGARVRVRLVPEQRPAAVVAALHQRVQHLVPREAGISVRVRSASPPVDVPAGHPAVAVLSAACQQVWGSPPALVRTGGSIPVAGLLQARGTVPLLLGFGDPGDGAHGPHERIRVSTLEAISATVRLALEELGR